MDPLARVEASYRDGSIPKRVIKSLRTRMKYVEEGVQRVQRAAKLSYPGFYVTPILPVTRTELETGAIGVLYARTIPSVVEGRVEIMVEISAPLILYATKGTLHGILAHEFLHYVDFARRFSRVDVTSDSVSGTIFESYFSDEGRLADPKVIFNDRTLIRLIDSKVEGGIKDQKLHEKTIEKWLKPGLPSLMTSPDSNTVSLPITAILSARLDPYLKMKLKELDATKGQPLNPPSSGE